MEPISDYELCGFFQHYPIQKEISHLTEDEIKEDYILDDNITKQSYFLTDEETITLSNDRYYKLELAAIDIKKDGYYNLQDYLKFLRRKNGELLPTMNIYLYFGEEYDNNDFVIKKRVEVKMIDTRSGIDLILQFSSTNIDNIQRSMYLYHVNDDYSELDNLLILKKYTRKIKMKNHTIKAVTVELTAGMTFVSDELTMEVIKKDKVRIQKGNLTQTLTTDDVKELLTEQLIGRKVSDLPKHIKKMMEETTIISEITLGIEKSTLNIFS